MVLCHATPAAQLLNSFKIKLQVQICLYLINRSRNSNTLTNSKLFAYLILCFKKTTVDRVAFETQSILVKASS